MTLLSEQQSRIELYLQETDTSPTRQQQIAVVHQECVQKLARADMFGAIVWLQGVASQALYTLPSSSVRVDYVLYNERVLHFASERMLDRRRAGWESQFNEPEYWTFDNQSPNVIRLIPQPVRTGSAILNPLFAPLPQYTQDNLVVFLTEDPSAGLTDPGDTLPTLDYFNDWLVFESTAQLASYETEAQNIPVAQLCRQLAQLWERFM